MLLLLLLVGVVVEVVVVVVVFVVVCSLWFLYEIIVVDDGSRPPLIQQFPAELLKGGPGAPPVRNMIVCVMLGHGKLYCMLYYIML